MSSPFRRETKRGTEESIEAMYRASVWLGRVDTTNDATDISVSEFANELDAERDRIKNLYQTKNTERVIDNYVFNNEDQVELVVSGSLDEKVSVLSELKSTLTDEFGYVSPPSLSKENLVWLVAQELQDRHLSDSRTDMYNSITESDVADIGEVPTEWENEQYPIHR